MHFSVHVKTRKYQYLMSLNVTNDQDLINQVKNLLGQVEFSLVSSVMVACETDDDGLRDRLELMLTEEVERCQYISQFAD